MKSLVLRQINLDLVVSEIQLKPYSLYLSVHPLDNANRKTVMCLIMWSITYQYKSTAQ